MTIWELMDQSGLPYEEKVIERYVHKARAERALVELPARKRSEQLLDGRPCYIVRELEINDEEA